jgi:hypothetical protein
MLTRSCGDCQACCKSLPLTTIGKPAGQRCEHQRHRKGCMVYGKFGRPTSCAVWNCLWILDEKLPFSRPDRAGFFVDPTPDFVSLGDEAVRGKRVRAVQVHVDAARPDAHRSKELRIWLAMLAAEQDIVAIVRCGQDAVLVLIPPRMSETKAWQELPVRIMKPLSVGEIRRAMINEQLEKAKD